MGCKWIAAAMNADTCDQKPFIGSASLARSHGNRDRVEPPGPNLAKSRDPLADPIIHARRQTIIWTNIVLELNQFENAVCNMAAIMSKPEHVNISCIIVMI